MGGTGDGRGGHRGTGRTGGTQGDGQTGEDRGMGDRQMTRARNRKEALFETCTYLKLHL